MALCHLYLLSVTATFLYDTHASMTW